MSLYETYTDSIIMLKQTKHYSPEDIFNKLVDCLFIQYADSKDIFFNIAKAFRINHNYYPELLDNETVAIRLTNWATRNKFATVTDLLNILPPEKAQELYSRITSKTPEVIFCEIYLYLENNFPTYGSTEFSQIKEHFERTKDYHIDEVVTNFKLQITDILEEAKNIGIMDVFIALALDNYQNYKRRQAS